MCDLTNYNQGYALHMFTNLIELFGKHQGNNEVSEEMRDDFTATLKIQFKDITYSILSTIHSNVVSYENEEMENQAGVTIRRLGIRRLRAIEFLKKWLLLS